MTETYLGHKNWFRCANCNEKNPIVSGQHNKYCSQECYHTGYKKTANKFFYGWRDKKSWDLPPDQKKRLHTFFKERGIST